MSEEVSTPLSEEEVVDLERQDERGKKMAALTATAGWTDLLLPYLEGGKSAAVKSLLKTDEKLPEFIASRQAFNTLDAVESFVKYTVTQGAAAHRKLYPEKKV